MPRSGWEPRSSPVRASCARRLEHPATTRAATALAEGPPSCQPWRPGMTSALIRFSAAARSILRIARNRRAGRRNRMIFVMTPGRVMTSRRTAMPGGLQAKNARLSCAEYTGIPNMRSGGTTMTRRDSHLWLPSTSRGGLFSEPVEIMGGQGVWARTRNHGTLLDANSGLWHLSLGYGPSPAVDAAKEALTNLGGSSLFRKTHPYAEELASDLAASSCEGDSLVYYATSGSEAVDTAIRFAIAYRAGIDSHRVAYINGSYHGVSLGPISLMGLDGYRNGCPAFLPAVELPHPSDFKDDPERATDAVRQVFSRNPLSAVVAEPVLGSGGIVPLPHEYLTLLADLCATSGTVLILDEITTGTWRCDGMTLPLNQDEHVIRVLGKGLTGGVSALSALLVPPRIWTRILDNPVTWRVPGTTHSGNPAACAAAIATLRYLRDETSRKTRSEATAILDSELASIAAHHPCLTISGMGHMRGITFPPEITQAITQQHGSFAEAVTAVALGHGLLVHPLSTGTIPVMPALTITSSETAELCRRLRPALLQALSAC